MASAALDHMISLVVFMAAIMIFIGLFSQSNQSALIYERHRVLSTKTSDLLDTILLNPGLPADWGKQDGLPDCFGLQDPEFPQYKLSTFSLMRLNSASEPHVYYSRTGAYYSNTTAGFGSYLLAPSEKVLDYRAVSKMLGINGTYGFLLTLTPLLNVSISPVPSQAHLTFDVGIDGTGYQLADASVTYSLCLVNQDTSYIKFSGTTTTDESGLAQIAFPEVNGNVQSYALIVYAHLYGLKGMGYYVSVPESLTKSVVPMIDSFADRSVIIAHGDSVGESSQSYSELTYNASFAILTDEYLLRPVTLDPATSTGKITVGAGMLPDYAVVNVPDNDGILIVTYKETVTGHVGIVLMPWGVGSMAFPITLGANANGQEWVTTDLRQVTIGGFAYEAKLALWNLKGVQGAVA